MSDIPVRAATPDDVGWASEVLTQAFADYPFTRHTIAADGHLERLKGFQRLFVEHIGLPHGQVFVAGEREAVAVWTTPESADVGSAFAALAPRLRELAGDRAEVSDAVEAALAPCRPDRPVWFLGTIGVHPARQGKGLGGAVIRHGLARADAAGVAAYLETSDKANVAVYERLGFSVTAELELPHGGPRTWCMRRAPH